MDAERQPAFLGEPQARLDAQFHSSLIIHHYGFLRKEEAFLAKSKVLQPALVNSMDDRILEAEKLNEPWWKHSTFPAALVPYDGPHPEFIIDWLKERGRI